MQVQPVADGLHPAIALQGDPPDGRVVLMEKALGVAQVGGGGDPRLDGGPGGIVPRRAVAHGHRDPQFPQGRDDLHRSRHLRGEGQVGDVATGGLLVLPEQVDPGLLHQQALRHRPLVLHRETGSLQVDAHKLGPAAALLDDLPGGPDGF